MSSEIITYEEFVRARSARNPQEPGEVHENETSATPFDETKLTYLAQVLVELDLASASFTDGASGRAAFLARIDGPEGEEFRIWTPHDGNLVKMIP